MKLRNKILLIFLVTFSITFTSAYFVLNSNFVLNLSRKIVLENIQANKGMFIDFKKIHFFFGLPKFRLENAVFKFENDDLKVEIESDSIDVELKPIQLIARKLFVEAVRIDKSKVNIQYKKKLFVDEKNKKNLKTIDKNIFFEKIHEMVLANENIFGQKIRIYGVHLTESEIRFLSVKDALHVLGNNVSFSAQKSPSAVRLFFDLDALSYEWQHQNINGSIKKISTNFELNNKEIILSSFQISKDGLNLSVHGRSKSKGKTTKSYRDLDTYEGDYAFLAKGDLSNLKGIIGFNEKISGKFRLEGNVLGNIKKYKVLSKTEIVDPAFLGKKYKNIAFLTEYDADAGITFSNISAVLANDGKINVKNLKISQEILHGNNSLNDVQSEISFVNAPLKEILGGWHDTVYPLNVNFNGEAKLVWNGNVHDWTIKSTADLKLKDLILDNQSPIKKKPKSIILSVPEVVLKVNLSGNSKFINFDGTKIILNDSSIDASGNVFLDKRFGLKFDSAKTNLANIGKLASSQMKGIGGLHVEVLGNTDDVWVHFDLKDIKDAEYLDLKLGNISGRISYEDARTYVHFDSKGYKSGKNPYTLKGLMGIGDNEFIDLDANFINFETKDVFDVFQTITKDLWWVPNSMTGIFNGKAKISGMPDLDKLIVLARANVQNAELLGEKIRELKVIGGYRQGTFFAEDSSLRKKNGTFEGHISLDPKNNLDYRFVSKKLNLKEFDLLSRWGIPLDGDVQLNLIGRGKIGNIQSDAEINFANVSMDHVPLKNSKLRMMGTGDEFKVNANVFDKELVSSLNYVYSHSELSNFNAKFKNFSLLPILSMLNIDLINKNKAGGTIDGNINLDFPYDKIFDLNGKVNIDKLNLFKDNFVLNNDSNIDVQFKNGSFNLDETFSSPNSKIQITGKSDKFLKNINLKNFGDIDLKVLEYLTPALEHTAGKANYKLSVNGDIDKLIVEGKAFVEKADAKVKNLEQKFESIKGVVKLEKGKLHFEDITSNLGGGDVRASGNIDFFIDKFPVMDLSATILGSKIKIYPFNNLTINGNIFVKGNKYPYLASGKLKMDNALIKQNFDAGQSSNNSFLKAGKYLPDRQNEKADLIELDIDVSTPSGLFVANDIMEAEFKGEVKLVNTLTTPRVLGSGEVIQGKILFRDYDFNINSCLVKFPSRNEFNVEYSLNAQTDIAEYKVILFANGDINKIKVDLTSNPQLPQDDLVSLLTLGATGGHIKKIKGEDQLYYSSAEVGGLLIDQLKINKDIQKKTGFKISLDQSVSSGGVRNIFGSKIESGDRAAPRLVIRKKLTDKIDVSAASTVGIGSNQQQEANLELHVNKNFSVLGVYENTLGAQTEETNTSLGADLKLKWGFK